MGWYERWAQWSERQRFLVDLTVTAAVCGLIVIAVAGGTYQLTGLQGALLTVAVLAPIPWSRTRPVASCVALFVICILQITVLRQPVFLPADFAVLVSMYCVTVYGPRWAYLMACGFAVVGPGVLAFSMWSQHGEDALQGGLPVAVVAMIMLACSFAFGLVRRSRRAMLEAMRDRTVRLEIERDQQAQIATAAERSRIAREMHDIVAHSLSVVIAQADGGRYAAANDPASAQRALGTIAETGRAALADMRRLLGILREEQPSGTVPLGLVAPGVTPPVAPGAGTAAAALSATGPSADGTAPLRPQPDATDISGLVDQARADGLKVSFARVGAERRLPPGVGLTLFRVCQESLTNVRKHAGPGPKVTVLVRWGDDEVELRIDDDGRGLAAAGPADADDPAPAAGFGLLGMRERAEMFGGTLTAGPRGGGGFSVAFVVPIPAGPVAAPADESDRHEEQGAR